MNLSLCNPIRNLFIVIQYLGVSKVLRMNEEILGGRLKGHEASLIINALRAIPQQLSSRSRREVCDED